MRLISTAENPAPQGAQVIPVKTADGLLLRAMVVPASRPQGTCIVLGGRGDFLERYYEVAGNLLSRQLTFAALDFRGQGGSARLLKDPLRGHVNDFGDFEEDVRAFMQQVVIGRHQAPYYLLAHSTAATVVLPQLQRESWFSAAVFTSPLLEINYGRWPILVARGLAHGYTGLGFGHVRLPGFRHSPYGRADFAGNPFSTDQARWNRDCSVLEAAPNLGLGAPTYSWLAAANRRFAVFRHLAPGQKLNMPVLAVMAGDDKVVINAQTVEIAKKFSPLTLTTIAYAKHDLLSDNDAVVASFWQAFDAFLGLKPPQEHGT